MSNPNSPSKDELEVAEAKNPLFDLVYDYAAEALTSRIGNFVYQGLDSILSTVEKTAKWSLPPKQSTGKTTISAPPLVRPLPWVLFLPALLALRLLRYFLSIVALLMGHQPVYPVTMVSYLQNKRRKLRAFKYRGLRLQRIRQAEMESKKEDEQRLSNSWFRRITSPLRYIVCLRAMRPVPSIRARDHHDCRYRRNEQSAEMADEPAPNGPHEQCMLSHKRNAHERDFDDSENSLDEESVDQLLEKYAHLEGDSSYQPSEITDFDSDSMNSDKSSTGTVEEAEKISTESNGHAATNGKDSQSTTENSPKTEESPKVEKSKKAKKSQKTEKPQEVKKTQETGKSQDTDESKKAEKPDETRQKSLLNALETNGNTKEKPVEPAPVNGTAASEEEKEPKEEKSAEATQKPVVDENTATKSSKPAVDSNPGNPEHPSEEEAQKLFEAISNQFQLNLDQQQQHQLQEPHNQHRPQQSHQHTAVNGGGGNGGKIHKKRHHHNAHHHH